MIGDNIRALRRERGMSQEQLAVGLHVVRQTISKWEKGLSVPDADMLVQLAALLQVPVSQLLGSPPQPLQAPPPPSSASSWRSSTNSWPNRCAPTALCAK